jgi:phage/plasmid-associated DNA primase
VILENSIVNIGSEVDNREIKSTEIFKRIVSGEAIAGRRLYHQQGEFASFSKLFFNMNFFVKMNGGKAECRRIRVVRFDKVIENRDTSIKRQIVGPEYRNVIFSVLVDRLSSILKISAFRNGSAKSVEWQEQAYRAIDRYTACMDDCFEKDTNSMIIVGSWDNLMGVVRLTGLALRCVCSRPDPA